MTNIDILRSKFCSLLISLNQSVEYRLWLVVPTVDDGDDLRGQNGLWNILRFPSIEEYLYCMLLIGFVGKEVDVECSKEGELSSNVTTCYFKEGFFRRTCNYRFYPIWKNGQSFIGIGQKKKIQTIVGGSNNNKIMQADPKIAFNRFWNNDLVKRLLLGSNRLGRGEVPSKTMASSSRSLTIYQDKNNNTRQQQQRQTHYGLRSATTTREALLLSDSPTQQQQQEDEECRVARKVRERAAKEGQCIICWEDKPDISTLCCGQVVHMNCFAKWLSSSSTSSTYCMGCRNPLPPPLSLAATTTHQPQADVETSTLISFSLLPSLREDEEVREQEEDRIETDTLLYRLRRLRLERDNGGTV